MGDSCASRRPAGSYAALVDARWWLIGNESSANRVEAEAPSSTASGVTCHLEQERASRPARIRRSGGGSGRPSGQRGESCAEVETEIEGWLTRPTRSPQT